MKWRTAIAAKFTIKGRGSTSRETDCPHITLILPLLIVNGLLTVWHATAFSLIFGLPSANWL